MRPPHLSRGCGGFFFSAPYRSLFVIPEARRAIWNLQFFLWVPGLAKLARNDEGK